MVDGHTLGSLEPSIGQNGVENGTAITRTCIRRIAHTTTSTVDKVTNRGMYKIIIQKQNAFIKDSSIIPVYDIEKRDVVKFVKLINKSKCIQDIEPANESKPKGKCFLITTKIDYRKVVIEVNDMIKYIYPDRELQTQRERRQAPIIHTNISTYA